VVQETFLQMVRDAGRISSSVPCWLHAVATRKALDAVRRDSRRRQREAKYAANRLRETEKWEDLSGYVDEAMNELDDQTRAILIERFFEARTTAEIAAGKDMSQPTASRRIESGLAELRTKLHNRGILVAAAALGALLAQNAAEAAPAVVLKELGKIALLGAETAAATAAAGAGTKAAAAGILSGVTAKIVTAAAVAAVGVGGVVTYNHVSRPVEQTEPSRTISRTVERSRPKAVKKNVQPTYWAETGQPAAISAEPPANSDSGEQDTGIETSGPAESDAPAPVEQDLGGGHGGTYEGGTESMGYGAYGLTRKGGPDDSNSATVDSAPAPPTENKR